MKRKSPWPSGQMPEIHGAKKQVVTCKKCGRERVFMRYRNVEGVWSPIPPCTHKDQEPYEESND